MIFGLVVGVAIIVAAIIVNITKRTDDKDSEKSGATGHVYKNGAVASDSPACSKIGVEILQEDGSAMDAAIATLFTLGVVHPHSSGIGGGGFMLVYERASKRAKYFDFRETAPAATTQHMFDNDLTKMDSGALAIAVPTEVPAMHKAWRMYGKLPWKRLLKPAINLAANGFIIDEPLGEYIAEYRDLLVNEKGFREVYYGAQGTPRKQGEIVTDRVFADTLRQISEDPLSMYNGSLAKEIARDIQERGGIITEDDLKVDAIEREVLVSSMSDDDTLYTTSAPSSGATLILILNILKGFNFIPDSLSTANIVQTWHRIIEAFKFGFAYRPYLGDPDFNPEVKKSEHLQIDKSFAAELQNKISTTTTQNDVTYYGGFNRNEKNHGTTHICVLAANGDAVSITSTVGYHFGAKIRSYKTGIVYNNHMRSYSFPGIRKPRLKLKPSPMNFIAPGKRSSSTICPTIVTHADGSVKMVVGSSGGDMITTIVATILMKKLWFGLSLEQCIHQPRLHHQLHPNEVEFETNEKFRINHAIIEGLRALGHTVTGTHKYCAVQAIYRDKSGNIVAMSDPRKQGQAAGY